jgi:hypothetical protein
MGQRAADLEAFAADRANGIATQGGAEGFDALDRQLGKIDKGGVLDLAVLAVGFPQQERGAGVAVKDLGDVHEASNQTDSSPVKGEFARRLTTLSSGFVSYQLVDPKTRQSSV